MEYANIEGCWLCEGHEVLVSFEEGKVKVTEFMNGKASPQKEMSLPSAINKINELQTLGYVRW
jgi:hypothetical protein